MTGAIHRFNRVITIFRMGAENHVTKFVPVTGFFPEAAIDYLRCPHFLIIILSQHVANVFFYFAINPPAIVMPEDHAGRFILQMKQIQTFRQFTMIAFFSFFKTVQISLQIFFIRPGSTVDTLQHFIFRFTTPVSTGQFHQFECFEFAGIWHVRTTA